MNKTDVKKEFIVCDENGTPIQTEYNDSYKISLQENKIETIEEYLKELKKEKESSPKPNKKLVPVPLYFALAALGIGLIFGELISIHQNNIFDYITMFWSWSITGVPIATIGTLFNYKDYSSKRNKINGFDSEIQFLTKQLEKENEVLEELKKEQIKNKVHSDERAAKMRYYEQLQELKEKLQLYYVLGSNEKKYRRYLKQGVLEEKLKHEIFSEQEIETAKEYLEEKGPKVKK